MSSPGATGNPNTTASPDDAQREQVPVAQNTTGVAGLRYPPMSPTTPGRLSTSPRSTSDHNMHSPTGGPTSPTGQSFTSSAIQADSSSDLDSEEDAGSLITDTTSLREYMRRNVWHLGRQFTANVEDYAFPNDDIELDRLDLLHHIFLLFLHGDHYISPMTEKPTKILDVGTGTGIWAMDMADKFPSAHVIGTDVSPVQPEWVPPNIEFQIDNATDQWTFSDDSFDMVHFRYMRGVFTDSEWQHIIDQCMRVLKPGGFFELQDIEVKAHCDDGTLKDDSVLHQFHEYLYEATEISRKPMKDRIFIYEPYLKDAGFINVERREFKCPVGTWAKDPHYKQLGAYMQLNSLQGYEGICLHIFSKVLGWSKERIDTFGKAWKAEIRNRKVHMYYKFHFISGQKPLADDSGF